VARLCWAQNTVIFFTFIVTFASSYNLFSFSIGGTFGSNFFDTTRPDCFITSDIGVVSAISVSSSSRDILAVDLTLAICVFKFFKPKLISGDEALA
jgi:hypothetical protein